MTLNTTQPPPANPMPPATRLYETDRFELELPTFVDRVDVRVLTAALEKLNTYAGHLRLENVWAERQTFEADITFVGARTVTIPAIPVGLAFTGGVRADWLSAEYDVTAGVNLGAVGDSLLLGIAHAGQPAELRWRAPGQLGTDEFFVEHTMGIGMPAGWSGFRLTLPNTADNLGAGYANSWLTASSSEHKSDIQPITDALAVLLHPRLHGVTYEHVDHDPDDSRRIMRSVPSVGFIADDWLAVVPQLVTVDADSGAATAMDYGRVGAFTFEALKEYIQNTDARLAALEERFGAPGDA
jgi:Chaperone of endosialidase